jgi:hypothetical protein
MDPLALRAQARSLITVTIATELHCAGGTGVEPACGLSTQLGRRYHLQLLTSEFTHTWSSLLPLPTAPP